MASVLILFIGVFVLGFSIYYSNAPSRYGADAGLLDPEYTQSGAQETAEACAKLNGVWTELRDEDTGEVIGYNCEFSIGGNKVRVPYRPDGSRWGS